MAKTRFKHLDYGRLKLRTKCAAIGERLRTLDDLAGGVVRQGGPLQVHVLNKQDELVLAVEALLWRALPRCKERFHGHRVFRFNLRMVSKDRRRDIRGQNSNISNHNQTGVASRGRGIPGLLCHRSVGLVGP